MNYRMVGYLFGIILLIEAALMMLPLLTALIFGESTVPFLITIGLLLLISLPLAVFKPKNAQIYAREGFVTVAGGWLLLSLFGSLPFIISGAIPSFIDALFETVSGLTTTGATILAEVESLPRGILLWRCLTHWIGGMGILVFMLAILPSSGGQSVHLMRAEVPGPTKGKLVPKMRHTAIILYTIYVALTLAQIIALLLCKLSLYDAIVCSVSTAGTGGFSVLNDSIAGYHNPAAEWVIAVFMILFGVNFNLYFFLLIKKFKYIFKNVELRTYLFICVASVAIISIDIIERFETFGDGIRTVFFQVASIITTTGFATTEFNIWPSVSKTVIIILMVTGACAGSTAGGLKISRVLILIKNTFREIKKMLRPHSVNVIRLDGEVIPNTTIHSATSYFTIYVMLIVLTVFCVSFDGFSFETNFTATLSCINNIGPCLGEVGAFGNFGGFSDFSKMILSLAMLIGRLEIIPMMILFSPSTWKKR